MENKKIIEISKARIEKVKFLLQRLKINNYPNYFKKAQEPKYLAIINEALTHTSANTQRNHERLEFLGDAVLRLAASEFIDRNFPGMKVGDRSALRAQIVSDNWLSEVGKCISIEDIIIIGPKAAGDTAAKSTIIAETTEALIGAIYECFKDIEPIINWLKPFWENTSNTILNDPYRNDSKSALQEWSQEKGPIRPEYICVEKSKNHGDPKRFFCSVNIKGLRVGQGWGRSRQKAEKEAAKNALLNLNKNEYISNIFRKGK